MVLVLLIVGLIAEVYGEELQRSYHLEASVGPGPGSPLEMSLGWDWLYSHDDGTMVWQLDFERVELGGRTRGLEGHALDVRRFGDGEVLEVGNTAHVMGGAPSFEAQDLLIGLMSPHVPTLGKKGSQAPKKAVWRLRGENGVMQETELHTTWTNLGRERRDGVACWHLRYEGTWSTDGRARGWSMQAQGPIEGNVWLRRRDMVLEAHEFRWVRQGEVHPPSGPSMDHDQTWVGSIVSQANAPRESKIPYMDIALARKTLGAMTPTLAACTVGSDWSVRTQLSLDISQVGTVLISGGTLDGEQGTCLQKALEGHEWPEHREKVATVNFELVVAEGRLRPIRGLTLQPREPSWWFVEEGLGTGTRGSPTIRDP